MLKMITDLTDLLSVRFLRIYEILVVFIEVFTQPIKTTERPIYPFTKIRSQAFLGIAFIVP